MINNYQKEVQTKLTKGLLDMIILQYLEQESMHGYQLITKIRKGFGVYFGPSTIYPLARTTGEKRLHKKRLEHGYRKTTKSVQADKRRQRCFKLTQKAHSTSSAKILQLTTKLQYKQPHLSHRGQLFKKKIHSR